MIPLATCKLSKFWLLVVPVAELPAYADPESFASGGPTLTTFFFCLIRGERIQIPLEAGHYRSAIENGVSPACWWWPNIESWLGSFVFFQGSGPITNIAKKPHIFCNFSGGGSGPPALSSGFANGLVQTLLWHKPRRQVFSRLGPFLRFDVPAKIPEGLNQSAFAELN